VDEQVQDDSWKQALRDFHQPVVAGRIRVRPPWVAPAPGMLDVVIDPGMAFGTGQHPTTRTSLELIAEVPRGPVLDAGCGTGVLSIAAARLGFGPIVAIDHDPHAVRATEAGGRANMVSIDAYQATIGKDSLPETPIVFANLTLEVLRTLASVLIDRTTPGTTPVPDTGGCLAPPDDQGRQTLTNPASDAENTVPDTGGCLAPGGVRHLVASGLRVHEVDDAVAAFAPLGLSEVRRLEEDGWASVRMAR
ncbi:MAG: methyltransferase domain-containing protein, partial [Mycobacteriaceae bacterium]|nr:methyltransferase domain-containing protein [Mycobacteriaceae bacterium]